MWISPSPSRVGLSRTTVIRRAKRISPVSGLLSRTVCSKTLPVSIRPQARLLPANSQCSVEAC